MSSLETAWYAIIAICCLVAFSDWRRAVYLGIVIDAVRDPVRKLIPGQPVAITLSGVLLWLGVVIVVLMTRRDELKRLYAEYPRLRTAFRLLLLALIPAAGVSIASYHRGYIMAIIGGASYLIPCAGILVGYAMLRQERDIVRFMLWYILVNSIMLISVQMEFLNMDVPALGGINFHWIRYRTGYTVDLMCGWYRSPDVMGLHAAHVVMFALILAIRPASRAKSAWLLPVLWALFCVFVSGRRKFIGIPLVFLAAFLFMGMLLRVTSVSRMAGLAIGGGLIAAAIGIFVISPDRSADYANYAGTLFTEGLGRSNEVIVGSTVSTLQHAGVIGGGLGSATQGRYHAGVRTTRAVGWQEDGISRFFVEFGVAGVLLIVFGLGILLLSLRLALLRVPPESPEVLTQLGLVSTIIGDAASYSISHQQFSGDPVSALLVTLMVGVILKMPGVVPVRFRPSIHRVMPWQRYPVGRRTTALRS